MLLVALITSTAFAFYPPTTATSSDADLASERRILLAYGRELFDHDTKVEQLSKKATLTNAEVDAVNNKKEDLKRRLPQIQQAIRAVIDKLKAANQFNNFDAIVLARVRDARIKALLQEDGGPKRQLERLANDLAGLAQELDTDVQGLRSRLRAQVEENVLNPKTTDIRARTIRVAFTPDAPVLFRKPLRCAYWKAVYYAAPLDSPEEAAAMDKLIQYCV
jgi:hypothetical protein